MLLSVSINTIIVSFNIDVVVMISNSNHLTGGGGGPFINTIVMQVVLAMTAMAPQFMYNHEQKTSA